MSTTCNQTQICGENWISYTLREVVLYLTFKMLKILIFDLIYKIDKKKPIDYCKQKLGEQPYSSKMIHNIEQFSVV